ncbi:MAG: bifunctional 4-hydroxy-2-oxoglutarate aldolase/2-dehydro-3-deoxy-phosphogluconate aldolase [Verrucomicrobiota bacterium]|nr:bifunctional 4-hydroxy-2-oxoglutarate aldolase/2-dehydro-3-deoxy-phosphogluconate aldolase [Verrucomicrobiota bacterium]
MKDLFTPQLMDKISTSKIIAVLVVEKLADAVPLAEALLQGGIDILELTLRTPQALECIDVISTSFPEITVGAGTVLTPQMVCNAKEAGAKFAVSPGFNPMVVKKAKDIGFPFAPGVCTPSDIEGAIELGCRLLKFFPAETIGGLKHLNSMAAPYKHLGLSFIPLGGLNVNNVSKYFADPSVIAIGGSWLAKPDIIKAKKWEEITQNAIEAKKLVK